ncbi:MAG: RsmE family RNA methyltransferase, partial [Calditrichia bacterium]
SEESRHLLQSRRKQSGQAVYLTDGRGHLIYGEISEKTKGKTRINVIKAEQKPFPAENRIHVGIGLIRSNRLDWAVEKLTELGIAGITPLICRFSNIRNAGTTHLQKVAVSAIKQSGQLYLPEIKEPLSVEEWISSLPGENQFKIYAAPLSNPNSVILQEIATSEKRPLILAVGPEGGFHAREIEYFRQAGFRGLNLGPHILRSETAAVTAISRLKLINGGDKWLCSLY